MVRDLKRMSPDEKARFDERFQEKIREIQERGPDSKNSEPAASRAATTLANVVENWREVAVAQGGLVRPATSRGSIYYPVNQWATTARSTWSLRSPSALSSVAAAQRRPSTSAVAYFCRTDAIA